MVLNGDAPVFQTAQRQTPRFVAEMRAKAAKANQPTRIPATESYSPATLRTHTTRAMTTTVFRIDLTGPAIGMNRLTSQRRTGSVTYALASANSLSRLDAMPGPAVHYRLSWREKRPW